ncbi:MAG: glycosyltransferase [Bacteroidia bacterium]
MKKLLIICYYWPPSGGAGVQRWLKLSDYIAKAGVEVFIIHPKSSKASYLTLDESLVHEINPNIHTMETNSFEPLNWYKRIVGKKNVPTAGMSNVNPKSKLQSLALRLRSTLFIPDPRKYWLKHAYKAAVELISKHEISHVITSSPPHSAQLIGLRLRQNLNIHWIADLRDLWTGIYYYDLLQHTTRSRAKDAKLELEVLQRADHITTVSPLFKDEFKQIAQCDSSKISVIPNGFDPKDFNSFNYLKEVEFTITYTGSISSQYNISPFIEALKSFNEAGKNFKLRFVGSVDPGIKERFAKEGMSTSVEFTGYVQHDESISYLEDSYALLLIGPLNEDQNEGSVPAKLFEYLAAKRHIIYIGKTDGFVAQILRDCAAGSTFENAKDLLLHLQELSSKHEANNNPQIESKGIDTYSRINQAEEFLKLLA